MAKHIKNLEIGAYRGIKQLEFTDLNHFNILTGDNNSGKTSILEILSSCGNPQDIGSWVNIIRENIGNIKKSIYYNGFLNLFPIDEERKHIEYQITNDQNIKMKIELNAEIEETQLPEIEMYRLNGFLRTGSQKKEDNMIDAKCLNISTCINDEKIKHYTVFDFQTRITKAANKEKNFLKTVYVSPFAYATRMLDLSDILSDAELYKEMLNILKEFDENITNINAVYMNGNMTSVEYVVLTKNHKQALPVSAYGDGMKKAISILSAMVEAKDGILLLDEFETAIHTSSMDKIFSWILSSAIKLNVQVFLTSHSKEAIDKVLKCNTQLQDNISLCTLYKVDDKNFVRCMNCKEAIKAQDNLGLELR